MLKRLQPYRFNYRLSGSSRESIDLVFTVLLSFQVTCFGAMLLVAFFVGMERQPSSQLQKSDLPAQDNPLPMPASRS